MARKRISRRRRSRRKTFRREDVRERVGLIFEGELHAKRVLSVADAVTGTLEAASISVSAIGAGLAANAGLDPKHAIKQVDRLLSNTKLVMDNLFEPWVRFVVAKRDSIVAAMDWTEFDRDDQSTICISLLTTHGRATPLVWKTVRKSELGGQRNNHEDDLIALLLSCLPEGVHLTLIADRGFGDQALYRFLLGNDVDFVIRFRQDILVTDALGRAKPAREWLTPSGRAKVLRNVSVTADRTCIPAVVLVHDKAMKDPWCLASSHHESTARDIVKLYGKRFKIEETFRDKKDPRFGLGLSQVRVGNPARRDRMLFICAIAHALLTLLGSAGERVGLDRTLKANTVKRRVHSLFRQGMYWYSAIPAMPDERLRLLITAFDEIVREHRVFRDTFGLV